MNAATDVLVAGAGLPGLAVAAALARQGLDVAVADRNPLPDRAPEGDALDVRVYAVSPGSASFLGTLGAWDALPMSRVAPVESMRVEGDQGAVMTFSAYDLGERALAWIVEERELRATLAAAARDAGVAMNTGNFARLTFLPERAQLTFDDGRETTARLVVGADGVRSWIRESAGIVASPRSYGQTAVVANFACERPHRGCAHQWFRADGGVLAWLPLPEQRISIVWSAPEPLAAELLALDAEALAARVSEAGGQALGDLALVTPPAAFPLSFLRLPAVVAHRLALVGDAAHGVHPLAGQGVNLGFGDAQVLAGVLAERGPVHDPGAPLLLERYARRRAEPVLAMHAVTDGLARLFGSRQHGLATLRNFGLSAVEALPIAKYLLAQPALR